MQGDRRTKCSYTAYGETKNKSTKLQLLNLSLFFIRILNIPDSFTDFFETVDICALRLPEPKNLYKAPCHEP